MFHPSSTLKGGAVTFGDVKGRNSRVIERILFEFREAEAIFDAMGQDHVESSGSIVGRACVPIEYALSLRVTNWLT